MSRPIPACPTSMSGEPESVIRLLDEQDASHGVLFPHDRRMTPPWDADYNEANTASGRRRDAIRIASSASPASTRPSAPPHTSELIDRYVGEWNCRGAETRRRLRFLPAKRHEGDGAAARQSRAIRPDGALPFRRCPARSPLSPGAGGESLSRVRFVLAHIGMHAYVWEVILACQEYPNIFVDMAQAFPFDIMTFIRNVSVDRLQYGSDVPYQSPRVEQEKLRVIGLSEEELEKVFWRNAARIWGIDRAEERTDTTQSWRRQVMEDRRGERAQHAVRGEKADHRHDPCLAASGIASRTQLRPGARL